MSSSFSQEIRHSTDIASIGVSFCNKYKKTKHIFHVRFYVDGKQQSFLQGKYINLKTCMSINLKSIFIWTDFKKCEILDLHNVKLPLDPYIMGANSKVSSLARLHGCIGLPESLALHCSPM